MQVPYYTKNVLKDSIREQPSSEHFNATNLKKFLVPVEEELLKSVAAYHAMNGDDKQAIKEEEMNRLKIQTLELDYEQQQSQNS